MLETMRNEKETLVQSILLCLKNNQLRDGMRYCQILTTKFPDAPEGWALSSEVAIKVGSAPKALEFVDRALSLDTNGRSLQILRAECLVYLMRGDEALKAANQELKISQNDPELLQRIGHFFSVKCDDHKSARSVFRRAVELSPNNASYWYNCGAEERFLGNVDEAEKCWNKAINLGPSDSEIFFSRSHLKKQTLVDNHLDELKLLIDGPHEDWHHTMHLHYALAKEYEDLGQFRQSFVHLSAGSDHRRRHLNYDLKADVETINTIVSTYSEEFFKTPRVGAGSDRPIFILGMPRTGTTLVERILGSHSQVSSAGELSEFALALMASVQRTEQKKLSRTELVKATANIDFEKLGELYLEKSQFKSGSNKHYIDKMPLNFLYCGLIHTALPKAKIIHVHRHPMDTIYAVYKQLFKSAYPMSYDLMELAEYYVGYNRLMAHWNNIMPGVIFNLKYEELVQGQELITRNILEFCDLNWEESCLSFEKNKAASTTASATQVRKPIYSTSIDRWREFEAELAPVVDYLRKAGIKI